MSTFLLSFSFCEKYYTLSAVQYFGGTGAERTEQSSVRQTARHSGGSQTSQCATPGGTAVSYFDSIYSDNLPSRAVTLYMYLCHRANSDGQCWPSEKRIAKDLSMSLSTVKRAISDLRKHGYIETEQRYRAKGGNSTLQFRIKSYPINTKG